MPTRKITPTYFAAHIRRVLKDGGSRPHAEGVQWFFKEEIKSRGWYTPELRKLALRFRRAIIREQGTDFLLRVADKLFQGRVLEEKVFAVFLLKKLTDQFDDKELRLFESWLPRISSWADHDALVHYLIAPMVASRHSRLQFVFVWAASPQRWHRRAACEALIQGARQKMFLPQIKRLSNLLLRDEDDMVQKGLGWLLRETAKYNASKAIPYLPRFGGVPRDWSSEPRAKRSRPQPVRVSSRHEQARSVRTVFRYSYAGLLRAGGAQSRVHPGLRHCLCTRIGVRVFARGLALWNCRGSMDAGGRAALVEGFAPHLGKPSPLRFAQKRGLVYNRGLP
jgi:3-methyladenine DNA glycosylase AlkD